MHFRLYHYWRSSSSWRVRWAMAIKGISCEYVAIDLLSDTPESPEHRARNPMGYVPVLEILDSTAPFRFLGESTAIIEYFEDLVPLPTLFPADPLLKARTRQLAEIISSGTQPLQNPNVSQLHSADPDQQRIWNQTWIRKGLDSYQTLVKETRGRFSVGDSITLADLMLVPQCYNAVRNKVELEEFPILREIHAEATRTEACIASSPEQFTGSFNR